MNIIKPKVDLIAEPNVLKRIELAGRTSYKSEDKISDGSAGRFFRSLVGRGHESVLEHSNIIVYAQTDETRDHLLEILQEYERSSGGLPHYIRNSIDECTCYIDGDTFEYDSIFSGNLRAWRNLVKRYSGETIFIRLFWGNRLFEDIYNSRKVPVTALDYKETLSNEWAQAEILPYAPGKLHNIVTARFTCSRAITHELVRHRELSMTQESTRYVKYGDLSIIEPHWFADPSLNDVGMCQNIFASAAESAETNYKLLIDHGMKQQDAREALVHATKAEIVMTGTIFAWDRFLSLRDDSAAHPDIRKLAQMFKKEAMFDLKWWEDQFDEMWWENG